jgi:asparagine synthase (glutamine-hydrolysing)
MTISDREVRLERYWRPDCTRELHYADDDQYAGRFSELFARAVGDRAPAGERLGAYLSGGLDSSSVVCMAHALGRQVETFSLLFPGAPEADEREYIDAVTDRIGAPAHRLTMSPLDREAYRQQPMARADLPDLPSDAVGAPLLSAMRARGMHTILTGVGGDHGFAGSLLHYADLLHEGHLLGLLRQWRADRGTADVGWSPGQLFTSGLRLLIPGPVRRAVRPVARRVGWGTGAPAWLDSDFVRRTCLVERLEAPRGGEGASLPTRRYVCELFESGWTARLLEATDRGAAEHGLELRHPFFDRALVEFAVAIPEAQRWRHRTTKFVMRQALRQLLPESVYARTGKADASRFIAHAVDALGGEDALRRLRIASLGWVRPDAIVDVYRRAQRQFDRGDEAFCDGMFSAWMTLAVDAWYRSVFVEGNVT